MNAVAFKAAPAATQQIRTSTVDVLVIGAGQAGLAVGHALRAAGVRYELDAFDDAPV